MEMFELRYFKEVAHFENIQKASESLHVSSSALSKAISRLEDEIGVDLFYKEGRNIKLTPNGIRLKSKAIMMLELEKEIKVELIGDRAQVFIRLAGPDALLGHYGLTALNGILKKFPNSHFKFLDVTEEEAIALVKAGEAELALTTKKDGSLKSEFINSVQFQTFVGQTHPLARVRGEISIKKLLEYDFATLSSEIMGELQYDHGWREDKFPRKIRFQNLSLTSLADIVSKGLAISYIPDYLGEKLKLKRIEISGCPYRCEQKIFLCMRDDVSRWLT